MPKNKCTKERKTHQLFYSNCCKCETTLPTCTIFLNETYYIHHESNLLSTTNFKYNNNHYQQIFGTAMGSPVSAVMANLVMEDLEKRALSTSLSQPCFWKRYVDDVCSSVKSNLVLTLQNHLNNIEPSIQFTVERETEWKISFLYVTVCRQDDGQLSTKVYRKPTHTERYLSFDSHHPVVHKRAVTKSLTDRAKTIPSSVDQQSKEMKRDRGTQREWLPETLCY